MIQEDNFICKKLSFDVSFSSMNVIYITYVAVTGKCYCNLFQNKILT